MNEKDALGFEDTLIQSSMLTKIDKLKTYRVVVKNLIKHPFKIKKISDLQDNVYYGYTDHPLDKNGVAPNSGFAFLRANRGRRSCSLLWASFRKRNGNAFLFDGRGYDVYTVRDLDIMFEHRYLFDESTRFEPLTLGIEFLRDDVYRLRLARGRDIPDNTTHMVVGDIADQKLRVDMKEKEDRYVLSTGKLRLELHKKNFHIDVFDRKGRQVTESGSKTKDEFPAPLDSFPLGFVKDKRSGHSYGVESFVLYPGEAVYGLGENFGPVNKVGRTVGMWNFEGLGNTSGRVYKNIPFFMSTRGYGVFVNDPCPMTFWVGSRETCKNMFAVEDGGIDYFFFYGPSMKRILNAYTALTGKPSMPPRWSFGTWMSRISYFSQEQVMAVAKKLREMKFPCDVIHIDTGWFEKDWRCDWTFSRERFPDPEKMFSELREKGFRVCLWQIPYVLRETSLFKDALRQKALAENRGPFVWLWNYEAGPIDFSRPEGVRWYQDRLRPLLAMGAASIKTDFGEQVEPFARFRDYDGRAMHNLYPLLYQKAAHEVCEEVRGKGEAVLWARSAWAGAQRYPVHWSGDNSGNHENLLSSLRGGLSLGLSGFTFWSQDTGGFVGVPADEAYIRWVQLSVFQSHFRFHGNPPHYREPWNFEPATQKIVRKYLDFRYRLIPYLYSESALAARQGLPLLRHLVIEFQEDPTVYHIEDQFMCGRNILVAPIMERNDTRSVYLPPGGWYDLWTGSRLEGPGWIEAKAAIDKIPVYIREGTVLPLAKGVQHTGELGLVEMTLRVYPDGEGEAGYSLYHGGKTISVKVKRAKNIIYVSTAGITEKTIVEFPFSSKSIMINLNGIKTVAGRANGI